MKGESGTLRQWTQRFTLASGAAFVVSSIAVDVVQSPQVSVFLALFGFICPMIFGMGYLLLPSYIGCTLVDHRLAGIHFALAFPGMALLVLGMANGWGILRFLGSIIWSFGILVFVGALLWTVIPAVMTDPTILFRTDDRSPRSTRFAAAMIPVAIGYLLLGTIGLVQSASQVVGWFPSIPGVVHLHVAGFGALLIFSLGARLLFGFYRVRPSKPLLWLVLGTGGLAPLFLGFTLWIDPWFRAGAALESIALVGYTIVVGVTGYRTEQHRFGYLGIALGAVAGVIAVAVAAPLAFGTTWIAGWAALHRTAVLWGFFPLTIVGYSFLFFPVTEGQFPGATRCVATTTILLLALGLLIQLVGIVTGVGTIHFAGAMITSSGGLLYCYLITRRLYG